MADIRIIGLDLDGTLLDEAKRITPRTRRALVEAAARGIALVPVTGRPWTGIPPEVLALPGVRYLITSNGASVRDLQTGELLVDHRIDHRVSLEILARLDQAGVHHMLFWEGIGYAPRDAYEAILARNREAPAMLDYVKRTRRPVDGLLRDFLREGEKRPEEFMVMAGEPARRDAVYDALRAMGELSFAIPFPNDLEITAQGADKGRALRELASRLNLPGGSIMALGDSGNDLTLLREADLAVAMGNATQEIKEAAAFVTASNEEDGVGLAVEKFVLTP